MSAVGFIIAFVIAIVATILWAATAGVWSARPIAAMFLFALALLLLPGFIHA